jgi:lambda repressor-like predicted transcriptional regulator
MHPLDIQAAIKKTGINQRKLAVIQAIGEDGTHTFVLPDKEGER